MALSIVANSVEVEGRCFPFRLDSSFPRFFFPNDHSLVARL